MPRSLVVPWAKTWWSAAQMRTRIEGWRIESRLQSALRGVPNHRIGLLVRLRCLTFSNSAATRSGTRFTRSELAERGEGHEVFHA